MRSRGYRFSVADYNRRKIIPILSAVALTKRRLKSDTDTHKTFKHSISSVASDHSNTLTNLSSAHFHLVLHLLVPLIIAVVFYRKRWLVTYLVMLSTMLIDIDHLLADPIYDPNRCSIGFHPLHRMEAIILYLAALIPNKTRVLGIGLCTHIILDSIDCRVTGGVWSAS